MLVQLRRRSASIKTALVEYIMSARICLEDLQHVCIWQLFHVRVHRQYVMDTVSWASQIDLKM